MPELPEVEVIRQGLAPHLAGRQVTGFASSNLPLRLPLPTAELRHRIVGHRVRATGRRGKYLLLEMDNHALLVLHLGMSGKLGLFAELEEPRRHDHFRLRLDNGMELRLNDTRRFGSVQVFADAALDRHPPFADLGPEPFSAQFSTKHLQHRAGSRKQPLKNFLMDSHNVVGIGNIYASEILFGTGLAPTTPAGALTRDQWEKIIKETRRVLARAIECGGTTIADFVNSRGEAGSFQVELAVYGKANAPCPRCRSAIVRTVMAGRATFHCPTCQP